MHSSSLQAYPETLQRWSGNLSLAVENADPNSWKWNRPEDVWKDAEKEWQDFNDRWLGATASPNIGSVLSIEHLNLYPPQPMSILVRESYEWMFRHVWAQAMAFNGKIGAIISGQPGTGKTLFLYYLLACLLQRKQVVVFSLDGHKIYLFYQNHVYMTTMAVLAMKAANRVPKPTSLESNVFIWSLFDIMAETEPAVFFTSLPFFPVQTASRNPVRYKIWAKHSTPLQTGLPLWSRNELAQGLKLQSAYESLSVALHWDSSQNGVDPLKAFPGTRELLNDLQECQEDNVSSSLEASMSSSLNTEVYPSPQEALDYLLDASIERFGYSARDVYAGVFNYSSTTRIHQRAFNIGYKQLTDAVSAILSNQSADPNITDCIIAIRPEYSSKPFVGVRWAVDFKSDWVAKNVLHVLGWNQNSLRSNHPGDVCLCPWTIKFHWPYKRHHCDCDHSKRSETATMRHFTVSGHLATMTSLLLQVTAVQEAWSVVQTWILSLCRSSLRYNLLQSNSSSINSSLPEVPACIQLFLDL